MIDMQNQEEIPILEDFVEEPEKKILQVFNAVGKFQSLCAQYNIDKAISDKIQHVLEGLVTESDSFINKNTEEFQNENSIFETD